MGARSPATRCRGASGGVERNPRPDLVPVRYERMLASPFAFLHGAARLMADDLASTPVTGCRVQAYDDAHLGNFGVFATPERNLVFDVNDFDETLRLRGNGTSNASRRASPWRLATSTSRKAHARRRSRAHPHVPGSA